MISIVYPTLNEESVIGDSLRAMRAKFTLPHELIVSDGHSTDKTVEIAKSLADIVVEHNTPERQNIAQGRNAGAKAAHGEFLVFMDADSRIPDPDAFFTRALAHFEKDPRLTALAVRLKVWPKDETFADKVIFGIMMFNLRLMNNVFHIGESPGEFQMMRKSVFDRLHGFDEHLVTREDSDMFLRLSKAGHTYYDTHLTVYHSGRRAHKLGWPHLLWVWMTNVVWVALFHRAKTKEWKVIR